jgi:hypothetical protein
MSGSSSAAASSSKAPTKTDTPPTASKDQKPAAALEEDDEFEDFPVEGEQPLSYAPWTLAWHACLPPITGYHLYMGTRRTACHWTILSSVEGLHPRIANILVTDWTQEETEVQGDNTHLWEESWDDDDTSDDFSAQLK